MTKPTQKLEVIEAAADVVVTDATGRKLTIKSPGILEESRLIRSMGESATNAAYMSAYVFPVASVVKIDDMDIQFPTTVLQVEALIQRVGRDGLNAVLQHMLSEAKQSEDKEAELKN